MSGWCACCCCMWHTHKSAWLARAHTLPRPCWLLASADACRLRGLCGAPGCQAGRRVAAAAARGRRTRGAAASAAAGRAGGLFWWQRQRRHRHGCQAEQPLSRHQGERCGADSIQGRRFAAHGVRRRKETRAAGSSHCAATALGCLNRFSRSAAGAPRGACNSSVTAYAMSICAAW